MRRILIALLMFLPVSAIAWGQMVETETSNRDRVVQIHTALNHLTVIEVGEPVLSVAAGSPTFKIEWRDNKVFVEPTAPNVSTNLFIWTASSRLNYELSPAGTVEQMDFAIDHPKAASAIKVSKPASEANPPKGLSHIDSMLEDKMVREDQGLRPSDHRVTLRLDDLFRDKGTVFIRYEIRNASNKAYSPQSPKVFLLTGVHSQSSLVGRENSQLSETEAHKLRIDERLALDVVAAKSPAKILAPGESSVGVVGVSLGPFSPQAHVLRIELPSDGHSRVTATLVL